MGDLKKKKKRKKSNERALSVKGNSQTRGAFRAGAREVHKLGWRRARPKAQNRVQVAGGECARYKTPLSCKNPQTYIMRGQATTGHCFTLA